MAIENVLIEQMQQRMTDLYSMLTYVTGGVVGLYFILIIMRWYEMRKMKTVMHHVEDHLRRLSKDIHQLRLELNRRK